MHLIFMKNDNDIVLVQRLLQHSSVITTQRYKGIMLKCVKKQYFNCEINYEREDSIS